jgi:hypothetical protein
VLEVRVNKGAASAVGNLLGGARTPPGRNFKPWLASMPAAQRSDAKRCEAMPKMLISPCSSRAPRAQRGGVEEAAMTPVLELTRGDILTRIEKGAKQRGFLYSATDLVRLYRDGKLDDADASAVADLLALAALLPDDDPLFIRL